MSKNLPQSPVHLEKELAKLVEFMLDTIAKKFINQGIKKITKKEQSEFASVLDSYSSSWRAKSKGLSKKAKSQFNDKRLKKSIFKVLDRANKYNYAQLSNTANSIGISSTVVLAKMKQNKKFKALLDETLMFVQQQREEAITYFTNNSIRMMNSGKAIDDIIKEFESKSISNKNKAKFLARNQLSNFNAVMNKVRLEQMGVKNVIWKTTNDGDRVRESHKDRHNRVFDVSKGCYSSKDGKYLQAGQDYNCRCIQRIVLDGDKIKS